MEKAEGSVQKGGQVTRKKMVRRRKKNIRSSVRVHDQTQFEAAFDYRMSETWSRSRQDGPSRFQVEGWFFFPPQMAGGVHDLTRARFYQDLRPVMRFKEARYTFKDFIGQSKRGLESPFEKIRKLIRESEEGTLEKNNGSIIYLVRVSACSFSSWLIKRVNRRCKSLCKALESGNRDDIRLKIQRADALLGRARLLLLEWHCLVEESAKKCKDPACHNELLLAEEYCHYRFQEGLARILLCLQEHPPSGVDGMLGKRDAVDGRFMLKRWSRWQWMVARHLGLGWIARDSEPVEQERHMIHLSYLKKRMWQALYLEVQERKFLAFRKQIGYMMAAGFAALWSFMAEYMIRRELEPGRGDDALGGVDSLIGMSGLILIFAFVISYILKDRIKELGRSRLSRGIFGDLPDFSERIIARNSAGASFQVGHIKEWVNRISGEKKLPDAVQKLRGALPGEWAASGQKVLYYKKVVAIDPRVPDISKMPFVAIRDITRFNIRRHLSRLDDPLQEYLNLSRDGIVSQAWFPKSYYLDIVFRYSVCNPEGEFEYQSMEAKRLIINKLGLQRIEHV